MKKYDLFSLQPLYTRKALLWDWISTEELIFLTLKWINLISFIAQKKPYYEHVEFSKVLCCIKIDIIKCDCIWKNFSVGFLLSVITWPDFFFFLEMLISKYFTVKYLNEKIQINISLFKYIIQILICIFSYFQNFPSKKQAKHLVIGFI